MIKLSTNCAECTHEKVCRHKDNAKSAMNQLKSMKYGKGPNDDYDWDIIMNHKHVDITFSCPSFSKKQDFVYR